MQIDSARLTTDDGRITINGEVINGADDPLLQVRLTTLVLDSSGNRRAIRADELYPEDFPIESHAKQMFSFLLDVVSLHHGDRVCLGVSAAATQFMQWTNDLRVPESEVGIKPPELVVLNSDDAPAALEDVQVIRGALGAPVLVRLVLQNRRDEPVLSATMDVFVFTGAGSLRRQQIVVERRPIPPLGSWSRDIMLNDVLAKPDFRVVVGLAKAETPTQRWANPALLEQAKASQGQPPRNP